MSYTEKTFNLPSGVSLGSIIVSPQSNTADLPSSRAQRKLAVFCHPWSWLGGRKEDPVLHDLVSPFIRRGYHVVLFNSRGVGQSSKWPSLSAMAEVEDLRQLVTVIIQGFIEEHNATVTSVVVLGYSHGSIPVSHHPVEVDVPAGAAIPVSHVLLSYPLSPLPLLTMFYHNTHATALRTLAENPRSNVLILYGDHDQFTGEGKLDTWSQGLQGKGGKVEVCKINGADHFWHGRSADRLLEVVGKWLDT
ncbi:alpha/beta-hydrolase [Serendipita vermifera]|nr:alpha/beta-hydrolase [Serendipita vermifera]